MSEILLSFFAIIGMLFLIIYVCDYLFYRNFKHELTLTVDVSFLSAAECIECFELITTIRQTTIGKAAIGKVIILTHDENDENTKLAMEYIRIFKIPGSIHHKD